MTSDAHDRPGRSPEWVLQRSIAGMMFQEIGRRDYIGALKKQAREDVFLEGVAQADRLYRLVSPSGQVYQVGRIAGSRMRWQVPVGRGLPE